MPNKKDNVNPDHYLMYSITPSEFCHKNNVGFNVGNIIKYMMRYKRKNGLEDLKKAKKYIELIAEFEYGEQI